MNYLLTILILISITACKPDMNQKIVQTSDVEIYTESFGNPKDPAVLLIMGATASMLWWDEEFCSRLANQGYFVIRYDNRDVGMSTTYPPGATPYSLDDLVEDAIGILNAYNLEHAHFVGMSLGGLITQIAALKYPEKVKSLSLISTGPFGPSDPDIPAMDERIIEFHARGEEVDWTDEDAVTEYLLEGAVLMSGSQRPYDRSRGEALVRAEFRRADNYVSMFNHAALQGGESYFGKVSEIEQPALIIHGTDDKIWNYRHTETLLNELDNARLVTLDGAGHEIHYQDWEVIIQAMSEYLSADN